MHLSTQSLLYTRTHNLSYTQHGAQLDSVTVRSGAMAELNTLSLPNVPSLPSSLSLAVSFVALKTGLLVDTTLSDDRCSKYAAKKHTAINKRKATPDTTPMII